MRTLFFFAALLFTGGDFLSAQEYQSSFNETFEVTTPVQFNATVSDGFIHVSPTENKHIKVFYIVRKGNNVVEIQRNKLDEFIDINIIQNDGVVDITIKHLAENRWNNWKNTFNVSIEVFVPRETSCNLKSSDGDIKIKGLSGEQKCRTSDGDIEIYGITGQVNCQTSDGDITAQDIIGAVDFTTSDGDIKADNVEGDATIIASDGDISMYSIIGFTSAKTSDGDIDFTNLAGAFKGHTSDGDITGNIVKLNNELRLTTSDGDIRVAVPKEAGLDIYLKGEDINTNLDKFTGQAKEHLIQGKVNGGGISVELTTSDGQITLEYE
jgi:hypothetical protein